MATNLTQFQQMTAQGEKIAMLTCYDSSFAAMLEAAGVDVILVGDSLGMVVQGHRSTLPVTLAQMIYHTECVLRGAAKTFIVADMPFGSYHESPQQALRNAAPLMAAGAQMVKLEGGRAMVETVQFLTARGIPVCAHIGLTPQSVHQFGGYRVQGKTDEAAQILLDDALSLQEAGAGMIVLEAIPAALAARVTQQLAIPTIGIGAGKECSGQVLVLYDLLGIYPGKTPKFARNFMAGAGSIAEAAQTYVRAVKSGEFPGAEHSFS